MTLTLKKHYRKCSSNLNSVKTNTESSLSVIKLNLLAVTHLLGKLCKDEGATGSAGTTLFIPLTSRDYFPV